MSGKFDMKVLKVEGFEDLNGNTLSSGHNNLLGPARFACRQESIPSIEDKHAKSIGAVAAKFTAQRGKRAGSTWTR